MGVLQFYLSEKDHMALVKWIKNCREDKRYFFYGLNRALDIGPQIGADQINRIYRSIARNAGLNKSEIGAISVHSTRVGSTQDLMNLGASMSANMQRGR